MLRKHDTWKILVRNRRYKSYRESTHLSAVLVFVKCTKKNHFGFFLLFLNSLKFVFLGEKYKPCKCKTSQYCITYVHFEVCALLVQL